MYESYLSSLPVVSILLLHQENLRATGQNTDGFKDFQLKHHPILQPSWDLWCSEIKDELFKRGFKTVY